MRPSLGTTGPVRRIPDDDLHRDRLVPARPARARPPARSPPRSTSTTASSRCSCSTSALLRGRFASGPRAAFMLGCLRELDAALRERGAALVVRARAARRTSCPRSRGRLGAAGRATGRATSRRSRRRRDRARDRGAGAARRRGAPAARRLLRRRRREPRTQARQAVLRLHAVLARWRSSTAGARCTARPRALAAAPAALKPGELPAGALGLADECPSRSRAGRGARRARRMERWLLGRAVGRYARPPRRPGRRHVAACRPTCAGAASRARELEERARAPRRRRRRGVRPPARLARLLRAGPAAPPRQRAARVPASATASSSGPTTTSCSRPGATGAPAIRSSTPGCASSPRPAGCTTARGWSSARS